MDITVLVLDDTCLVPGDTSPILGVPDGPCADLVPGILVSLSWFGSHTSRLSECYILPVPYRTERYCKP